MEDSGEAEALLLYFLFSTLYFFGLTARKIGELLELESHLAALEEESRAVESRPSREEKDERP